MISVPRGLLLALGALFSAYHLFLAAFSLHTSTMPATGIVAMVLYGIATILSLWPGNLTRMPVWIAAFDLAVCVALPLLVTAGLNSADRNGYATWYVAAVGTLMTITAAMRREPVAWLGVGFLVVHTVVWSSAGALVTLGVIGSVVWVATAHVLVRALAKAARDADQLVAAEREASQWRAAQEARVSERQLRLRQTYRMAAPILTEIIRREGDLTEAERLECSHLEGALRDEIRGRRLLNDEVRQQVLAARRRGTVVSLLDEGGIDEMDDEDLAVVLHRLAVAIDQARTDKLIIRTVPVDRETAVTVVGLKMADDDATALGADWLDDEVELWLEIPRAGAREPQP